MSAVQTTAPDLHPAFLKLAGRTVVLIGGGVVAAAKLNSLLSTGARVVVVAPAVVPAIERLATAHNGAITIVRRGFRPSDLDAAWFAVAAATPAVNRRVARAAEARRVFVNAVDDPDCATVYAAGVVRRAGVTVAISTGGRAPALAGLLRQALETLLPADLDRWVATATRLRPDWKARGVSLVDRRPLLLRALNRLYRSTESHERRSPEAASGVARVSLVGAGPGDPALLTRLAASRLRSADLVLYDALVDPNVLRLARRAQKFFVGKRAGRHLVPQATIHRLMIGAARRGKRVVRLKGGDPFVLGRGGEEALALAAAGVPFEIVPGVSSAIAAPALAGIPVTHRGVASGFLVVSGHPPGAYTAALEGLAPGRVTVVVLMGLASRAEVANLLRRHGWADRTPAAIVSAAATARSSVWIGTLRELATAEIDVESPATVVIGDVVTLASRMAVGTSAAATSEPPNLKTPEPHRAKEMLHGRR